MPLLKSDIIYYGRNHDDTPPPWICNIDNRVTTTHCDGHTAYGEVATVAH